VKEKDRWRCLEAEDKWIFSEDPEGQIDKEIREFSEDLGDQIDREIKDCSEDLEEVGKKGCL